MVDAIVSDHRAPANVDANERIAATVAGGELGAFTRCFPPTPSMTMNATTFGIHATLSYLVYVAYQR